MHPQKDFTLALVSSACAAVGVEQRDTVEHNALLYGDALLGINGGDVILLIAKGVGRGLLADAFVVEDTAMGQR